MSSVPGIYSAQRFKTASPGFPRSLALYSVTSEKAFESSYYQSIRGMGEMAGRIDERQHHVNLFEGLDAAPIVPDSERLLIADRAVPADAIGGVSYVWLKCVGRDFSTPYRGVAVVPVERVPASNATVAVYCPASARFVGRNV
jgi:hypothetical protein